MLVDFRFASCSRLNEWLASEFQLQDAGPGHLFLQRLGAISNGHEGGGVFKVPVLPISLLRCAPTPNPPAVSTHRAKHGHWYKNFNDYSPPVV